MTMGRASSRVKSLFFASVILYAFSPFLLGHMKSEALTTSMQNEANREERNASSFAVMLGEFRTSVGDMLFIKTERYLDSGIGYAPHLDEREMSKSGKVETKDSVEEGLDSQLGSSEMKEAAGIKPGAVFVEKSEHNHGDSHEHHEDHKVVQTLIKSANHDFRGFIGNLERQVKPWRPPSAPHHHTAGTELLPWYRLATLSDPHNVRNYMIGAWWLKTLDKPEQLHEAIKFLDEGILANPNAYELYLMKGYVLYQKGDREEARKLFHKSADLAIKNRPPGGPDSAPGWDITDDEQMDAAMTMDVMLTRDLESTSSALQATKAYLKRMPEAGSLKRMLGDLQSGN